MREGRLSVSVPRGLASTGERAMSPELTAIIVVGLSNVAGLAFLWGLHRDVADLRERMARIEGLFEGFTRRETAPPPA